MNDPDTLVPGEATAAAQLLQLLLDEQARAWQQGQRLLVETFLERHPALPQRPQALLQLIAQEIVLRERAGETASLQEYRDRFPNLHDQLRDRLITQASLEPEPRAATLQTDLAGPAHTGPRAPAPESWPAIPGYEIAGVLGRGGMGVVLQGRDPELRRDLAVKVLLAGHRDDPAVEQRFIEEAQIGGQLQHPGVVPVYALGRSPDGRPYFTMKLVKGRTLAELLRERAAPAQELPRFLGIFRQVCQTLAYAHSQGVIHRDLKPANVMVGAFGEVQVMDWGLAKVLGAAASPEPTTPTQCSRDIRTVRSEGANPASTSPAQTQLGSVMGTPSHMAPEQARGDVDQIDERTDVFGLGAILCEILTDLPPYVAERPAQVYPKAVAADLKDALARLQASGADAELLRLARTCLAVNPEERPRNAGAVAEAITTYQNSVAERLRQAELERTAAQVKAQEERKRRRLAVGLAVAVVGVVLVGGGSAFWLLRQAAERRLELRQGVEAALDRAAQMQQQARWAEARAFLDQAEHRLGGSGPMDLRRRVEQAQSDLRLVGRLDAARLKAATWLGNRFDDAAAERAYAAALRDAGLGQEGDDAAALAARVRNSPIRAQLVAALDDWAGRTGDGRRQAWLLAAARQADPDPRRNRWRDPALWRQPAKLERLAGQVQLGRLSPQLLAALGGVLQRQGGRALPLLTAAQRRYPTDFWLTFDLGNALSMARRLGEAVGYYRAALALRPSTYAVHINLGVALKDQGDLDGAIACFQKALALDPRPAFAHTNLGVALQARGELDRAIACHERALALDPRLAHAHANLGAILRAKGALDRAIACLQKALALDPRLVQAHAQLGDALHAQGQLDRAIACYERALALDPRIAPAHVNLGAALHDRGDLDRAIACFQKALALDPRLASAHVNLGNALKDKGDLDGAIICYHKALVLDPREATAHANLGAALSARGHLDGAIACYQKALALDPRMPLAHYNLGNALAARGQLDEAVTAYRRAIRLDPGYAEAHCNLGSALQQQGRFTEARDAYQRGHQLGMKRPRWPYPSARWLRQAERLVELDAQLPQVLTGRARPQAAQDWVEFAALCYRKRLFAGSARLYRAAFSTRPPPPQTFLLGHRYNAACAAALAGQGQGQDAAPLGAAQRGRWRQQAREWLRAELAHWSQQLEAGGSQAAAQVQQQLRHWQRDPDLAGLRDAAWIVNLPAEELRACRQLWADVQGLLQRAGKREPRTERGVP
jgi:tetratricopeptide (TPR) repeat protein